MVHANPLQVFGRDNWLNAPERSFDCSQPQSETRPNSITAHRPHLYPLSIEESLKCCAKAPVRDFALIAILDDGKEVQFTSTNLTPFQPKIFSSHFKSDFHKSVRRASLDSAFSSSRAYNHENSYNNLGIDSDQDLRKLSSASSSSGKRHRGGGRARIQTSDESGDDSTDTKKAKRNHRHQYDSGEDLALPIQEKKTQMLRIGDSDEVTKLYTERFKDLQQAACKVMGKAFVKLVEPRKQTHYPYTKGPEKAPPWWPCTEGEQSVRHREPDHLYKPERVRLLVHILKMIIEPHEKQCLSVQKLGLNVKKLEEVTMEAMSHWFSEKDHPENSAKKPFLKEIFKVAKQEERYKNGECSPDTYVSVMYGDRNGVDLSDDEPDEGMKLEEDETQQGVKSPVILTPHSLVSPSIMQPQPPQHSEHESMYNIPPRSRYNPQPDEHGTSSYVIGSYGPRLSFSDHTPNMNDHSQRSMSANSMTPSHYQSSQQQQSNGLIWHSSFNTPNVSSSSPTSNYYTTSPQSQSFGPSTSYQLPPPNTQGTVALSPHNHGMLIITDGLPSHQSQGYDSGPRLGNQLRTGSLGHPHQIAHHGYDMFSDTGAYGNGDGALKDENGLH